MWRPLNWREREREKISANYAEFPKGKEYCIANIFLPTGDALNHVGNNENWKLKLKIKPNEALRESLL